MTVSFDLPDAIEQALRNEGKDPSLSAREALLVEFYRLDRISHFQLGEALGLSRFQVDELLKRYGVTEDLPSSEEHEQDLATARRKLRS